MVTIPEERPGAGPEGLPGTRWQSFKAVLGQRFGALVKINIWMLLFAIPAILVFFLNAAENAATLAAMPFSSNAGVGYPFFDDIVERGNYAVFLNGVKFACLLVPALIIAGIGLAGGLHTVGLLFGAENVKVTRNFLKGIKRNGWQFCLGAAFLGIFIGLAVLFNAFRPVSGLSPFWSVFLQILVLAPVFIALIFIMYLFTQTESYKLRFGPLLKNSLAFAAGKFLPNILFIVLSILPMSFLLFLSGNAFMSFLILFILGLFAFSYLALIWTIHTKHVYERAFNE